MNKKAYIQPETTTILMQIQPLMDPSVTQTTIGNGFEEGAKDDDSDEWEPWED